MLIDADSAFLYIIGSTTSVTVLTSDLIIAKVNTEDGSF